MLNTTKKQMKQTDSADERWEVLMDLRIRAQLLEEKLGDMMVPVRYVVEAMEILEELDELLEMAHENDQ